MKLPKLRKIGDSDGNRYKDPEQKIEEVIAVEDAALSDLQVCVAVLGFVQGDRRVNARAPLDTGAKRPKQIPIQPATEAQHAWRSDDSVIQEYEYPPEPVLQSIYQLNDGHTM